MRFMSEQAVGQYVTYTFFKARPEWRRLPVEERAATKDAFADAIEESRRRFDTLNAYSTTGVRPDCDFFFWKIAPRYEDLGEFGAALNATPLAGWMDVTYNYLATTKASSYTSARRAAEDHPEGLALPRRVPIREGPALVRAARGGTASARWTSTCASATSSRRSTTTRPTRRDRRPGVHDGVRVRRAGRLHAPDG